MVLSGNVPPANTLDSIPFSVPIKRTSFPISLSTKCLGNRHPGEKMTSGAPSCNDTPHFRSTCVESRSRIPTPTRFVINDVPP